MGLSAIFLVYLFRYQFRSACIQIFKRTDMCLILGHGVNWSNPRD